MSARFFFFILMTHPPVVVIFQMRYTSRAKQPGKFVLYASMSANVAFCSMNSLLGPTSSPISMENT